MYNFVTMWYDFVGYNVLIKHPWLTEAWVVDLQTLNCWMDIKMLLMIYYNNTIVYVVVYLYRIVFYLKVHEILIARF